MKKELTRRSFLKLAGVGALAVAMSGSLTGCDVIDNLKDMDSVSAAIGDVKFMMSADVVQYGFSNVSENRTVGFSPLCEVRNNSKKAVTYGGSGSHCEVIITGVFENEDGNSEKWEQVCIGNIDDETVQNIVGEKYIFLDKKLRNILRIPSNLFIWQHLAKVI